MKRIREFADRDVIHKGIGKYRIGHTGSHWDPVRIAESGQAAERRDPLEQFRALRKSHGVARTEPPRQHEACARHRCHTEELPSSYSHFCCPLSRK